jgi:hypothetical protein
MCFLFPPELMTAPSPPQCRGHRPCHSAAPGSGPAGGHSPRPAPAPPSAGALRPLGWTLAYAFPGPAGLQGTVPRGRGRRGSCFLFPPGERKIPSPFRPHRRQHSHRLNGRGHRPCHSATLILVQLGAAQSPRPAPAPPMAGALHPPGRALASVLPGLAGLRSTVQRGRGKRAAFPVPARTDDSTFTTSMAGAIAPATAPQWDQDQPGAQRPPASARPATGGRFAPAGTGAGLCVSRTFRSTGHRPERAGETRCVSCSRTGRAKAPSPLQWQGPSPLPQRYANPCPAGGQSARPAPDPPLTRPRPAPDPHPAGASHPPGRALASVSPGPTGLQGNVPRGRGKRAAFPDPARRDVPVYCTMPGLSSRGHRPCHSAARGSGPAGGPKPPASARPATGGRWPLSFPDPPVYRAPFRAGGGNAARFLFPTVWNNPFPRTGKMSRQPDSRHPFSTPLMPGRHWPGRGR